MMHSLLPDANRATAKGTEEVSPAAMKTHVQVIVGKTEYNVILSLSRIPCLFIHEQVHFLTSTCSWRRLLFAARRWPATRKYAQVTPAITKVLGL